MSIDQNLFLDYNPKKRVIMNFSRESIFVSSLRILCGTIAAVLGLCIAIVIVMLAISSITDTVTSPTHGELVICADAHGDRHKLEDTSPVILKINFNGVIGEFDLTSNKVDKLLLDSREGVLGKNRVKGILLYFNTPGGLATDSSTIYRALKNYKEKYHVPIYGYVDGLCASGGMFIACAADKIHATSDSVIGSVGVVLGPAFNFSDAMQKIGVAALTLTEGKDKDTLNPFRPWKPGEEKPIQNILADTYQSFVNVVVENRTEMTKNKLIEEYGARVFIAKEAQGYGYIDDAESDYNKVLTELVIAAGIGENQKYQVLQIEPPHSILEQVAQTRSHLFNRQIKHVFPLGPYMTSDMSGKLLYLYQP